MIVVSCSPASLDTRLRKVSNFPGFMYAYVYMYYIMYAGQGKKTPEEIQKMGRAAKGCT